MLLKSQFWYLRRSFEKYIEYLLEEAIYRPEPMSKLVVEYYVEYKDTLGLSFSAKEVELVIEELKKKGYSIDEDKRKSPSKLTIHLS